MTWEIVSQWAIECSLLEGASSPVCAVVPLTWDSLHKSWTTDILHSWRLAVWSLAVEFRRKPMCCGWRIFWNFSETPVAFNSRLLFLFLLFFWLGRFSCFTLLSSPLGPCSVYFSSFHGSIVGILSWNLPLVDELVRTWTFQQCRKLSSELAFVLKASAFRVLI